jgi:membrane-bound lytic murein transglycosylase A
MPVPDARPSEKIAKLFPQADPLNEEKPANAAATVKQLTAKPAPASATSASDAVPLPEPRPNLTAVREARPYRRSRHRQYQ